MPVLSKEMHNKLRNELAQRYSLLLYYLERKELNSPKQGLARGRWPNPDAMCETAGNQGDIRLAVEDFNTILKEIKRLK